MSEKPVFDPDRAWKKLLFISVFLFAGVSAFVLSAIGLFGYQTVRSTWDELRAYVIPIKWACMLALVYHWPAAVGWAAARWNFDEDFRDFLLAARWRVAVGLAIVEALFGQNLIGRLLA